MMPSDGVMRVGDVRNINGEVKCWAHLGQKSLSFWECEGFCFGNRIAFLPFLFSFFSSNELFVLLVMAS